MKVKFLHVYHDHDDVFQTVFYHYQLSFHYIRLDGPHSRYV